MRAMHASLPRNRVNVPTELMAATRRALLSITMKARRAALQKLYPYIAVIYIIKATVKYSEFSKLKIK